MLTLTLSASFFRGTALPWLHRQTLDTVFLLMQKISLSTGGASAAIHEVAYLAGDKWAVTNGVGDRTAVWAIGGAAGKILHRLGTLFIMCLFPVVAVFM
jgi:hypothetical protein